MEIKRPATLHPALRAAAEVTSCAEGCTDESRFVLKTPLLGKIGEFAPSPFWLVLEVPEEAAANMELKMCSMSMPSPTMALADFTKAQLAKRNKGAMLKVTFPVLVNSRKLERGEVLTVYVAKPAAAAEPDEST